MKKFWRFSLLAASGLFGFLLASPSIVGEAKVIQGKGLQADDAVIVGSNGKIYSHTEDLENLKFTVRYRFTIDNSVSIQSGDIMYFYLPANIHCDGDFNFPLKMGLVTSGQVSIPAFQHTGVITFNSYFTTGHSRYGGLNIPYVPSKPGTEGPGLEEDPEPEPEDPEPENPGTEEPEPEDPEPENPGTEEPEPEDPEPENPGTEIPGTEIPEPEEPKDPEKPEVPGVTTPHPNPSVPGVTNPEKPTVTTPGHPGSIVPGTSTPTVSGGAGGSIGQSGKYSSSTRSNSAPNHTPSSDQQMKILPQTSEHTNQNLTILGLGLLALSLGFGYIGYHLRKEH